MSKRKTNYSNRKAKFMQDMVAVLSLQFENEFSIDSLTEDLKDILSYPINLYQMVRNLQHLKGLGARTGNENDALKHTLPYRTGVH